MRRLFVLCIALMLTFTTLAFAESFDVSSLSYEELVQLNQDMQVALFGKKLGDGVTIPIGTYIAGTDIPAGTYVLTAHGEDFYLGVYLYDKNGKEIGIKIMANDGDTLKVSIPEDGMAFSFFNARFNSSVTIDINTFTGYLIGQ